MAVRAPDDPVRAGHAFAQRPEEGPVFLGQGVAGRVRHVDGARPRLDRRREDLDEVVGIAPRGVLGGELDVVEVSLGAADRPHRSVEHLRAAHHQLVLQVDVGGGDEDVDARSLGVLDRADGTVDVLLARASEREHDRAGHHLGHASHGIEVALGGGGEAGLDDVHAQMLELAGDHELLLHVHGGARRLLPVAERRIEDLDAVHRRLSSYYARSTKGHEPPGPWPLQKQKSHGGEAPARGVLAWFGCVLYTPARAAGGLLSSRPRANPSRSASAFDIVVCD